METAPARVSLLTQGLSLLQYFDTRSLYYSKSIEYNDKIKSKFCVNNNIKLLQNSNVLI